MKCPFCGADETAVADTRLNDEGDVVRRRRRCNACDKRFTTYERAEIHLPQVIKKNGLRTDYSREKLRASLELALRKLFVAGELTTWPLREPVAGVSVGIVDGEPLLDLQ
jgi:transcriptional repressor NrdR